MNKVSWRNFPLIPVCGLTACAMLSLVFVMFAVLPIFRQNDEAAARRIVLAAARAKTASLAAQVTQVQNELLHSRQLVDANPLELKGADHLNDRLADMTHFCTDCGLEIQDIAPGATTSGTGFQSVPIHLTARGSFHVCMVFLHRLRDRFLDVGVTSFQLSNNSGDPSLPLSVEFELRWFATPDGTASSQ
jgi:Tfp pilus assembly protein PilO